MKKKETIMLLQKLIDSQSWSLNKAWDHLGEDYAKAFDAMLYAKRLLSEEDPDYRRFPPKKDNK